MFPGTNHSFIRSLDELFLKCSFSLLSSGSISCTEAAFIHCVVLMSTLTLPSTSFWHTSAALQQWKQMYCNPGRGVLGSICTGNMPLASPNSYPIIVYSVANCRPHVSHFWANISQTPTCQNLLTPEIAQMYNPILVTLLAPIENATPL